MTREEMVAALTKLGEVLSHRGIDGHIYIVGRAAMVLAFHSDKLTRDIDAKLAPSEDVIAAATDVAGELELEANWLSDAAAAFIPGVVEGGVPVLEVPGLTVRAAPAEVVLAMKLLAARRKDEDDIRQLAAMLDLRTVDEVWRIFQKYYALDAHGGRSLVFSDELQKARALVEDLFGPPQG